MNAIRQKTTAVLSALALVLGMTTTAQAGLFNTSPIDTWEGAGAVFNNAGGLRSHSMVLDSSCFDAGGNYHGSQNREEARARAWLGINKPIVIAF